TRVRRSRLRRVVWITSRKRQRRILRSIRRSRFRLVVAGGGARPRRQASVADASGSSGEGPRTNAETTAMPNHAPRPRLATRIGLFLGAALAFGLACGQAPLYYSNQNQYFLHGLAAAGQGHLGKDWLAHETLDPTPVFSGLVFLTVRFLHEYAFHLYYI